ncbi:MAG: hypothetical protein HKN47_16020 [Pirellulaceae bacterium]|nr:hypothetical protein [Pirellulaceae bacterium]
MKTELSIEIDRPIDAVFDYTNNQVPLWSKIVVTDQIVNNVNNGDVGTTFRVITHDHGREMIFDGEVIQFDAPYLSRVIMRGPQFDIDVEYVFVHRAGRTRVTQRSQVIPKGLVMKVMFGLFGWMFKASGRRALEADFATLKQQLEAEA